MYIYALHFSSVTFSMSHFENCAKTCRNHASWKKCQLNFLFLKMLFLPDKKFKRKVNRPELHYIVFSDFGKISCLKRFPFLIRESYRNPIFFVIIVVMNYLIQNTKASFQDFNTIRLRNSEILISSQRNIQRHINENFQKMDEYK